MKRFDLVYGYCGEAVMTQDDAGDWVRYDDAAAELARVTKQRDEAWGMVEAAYAEGWNEQRYQYVGDEYATRADCRHDGEAECTDDWQHSDTKRALDAARAESESPTPDMNQERGIWRCEACGEALPESCIDPDWRWAGDRWQHTHGQAGHIDARYFARAESD